MKILLTNDAQKIAGGENYVLHLAEGLTKKGHNISIAPLINSDLERISREKGFETIGIPYGAHGKEFNAIKTFVNKCRDKGIDLVHSNSNLDRTIAAVGGKVIHAKNVSSIHSCFSINRNLVHWYRNKFLINHFTPVGYSTRKIMIEKDKISPGKITVVHIGIPENRIKITEEGRLKIRREFNIKQDEIVIGTLSRLVEFKGHKFLIKAFSEMEKFLKERTRLLIAGDGELKESLLKQTKEYGIEDRVIFAGNRNDISDILSSFDILSQFSLDEGGETFPVSIIEALAAGLPVVGSRVGDIEYLVDNNQNGYLVEPENIKHFNKCLSEIILNDELRIKMGKSSRLKFMKNFTLDAMIENMINVYYKVIKIK
jgi:glycosyltransferase involved in cell wall biosynthesis